MTLSPTATLVTAEPISVTVPAFSWPIVYGSRTPLLFCHWPSDVQIGSAHTGALDADDDVVRALQVGAGTSSSVGCWSYSCTRTAFMSAPGLGG